jgi:hypothetical protein
LTPPINLPIIIFFATPRRLNVHNVSATQQEEKEKGSWFFEENEVQRRTAGYF